MIEEEIKSISKHECERLLQSEKGYNGISFQEFWEEGAKWGYIEGQTSMYSDLCKERERLYKELITNFTEQLGLLDKEDDELFSLKAIKVLLSMLQELNDDFR